MGLREDILATNDQNLIPVEVVEWNRTVYVPGRMSVADSNRMEDLQAKHPTCKLAATVAAVTRDDAGRRLFTDEDVEALAEKAADALIRISEVFAAKNGGDAVKNSEPVQV
jgi:hypothetical protein